ncbi:MAG: hypothetical protein ACOZQL_19540 [Myxococcota bacterium]
MKRTSMVFTFALLLGCEVGLKDREAELIAAHHDEAVLAAQLNQLSTAVAEAKSGAEAEQNRANRALSALREAQVSTVELWKGEPAALAEKKKAAKQLTPTLSAALDLAQSVAGGEIVEKRFARALAAGDVHELGPMLEWWESPWVEAQLPKDEEEEVKVCPTTRSLSCKPIDEDSLWCPDPEQGAAWAMVLRNADLSVFKLVNGQSHTVDSRLAPGVWLTRMGAAPREVLFIHELHGTSFVTQGVVHLEGLAADGGVARPLESFKSNLDADPFVEALFWDESSVLWADPTSRESVRLEKDRVACASLDVLEGVPRPVRQVCARLEAPPPAPQDAGTP